MNEKFGLGRKWDFLVGFSDLVCRVDPVSISGWTGGSVKPGRVDPGSYLGLTRSQLTRSLLRVPVRPVRPAGSTRVLKHWLQYVSDLVEKSQPKKHSPKPPPSFKLRCSDRVFPQILVA